jgi:hypothetical protein
MVNDMNIERTYRTKYWRPIRNLKFSDQNSYDIRLIKLNNFIAKKIKICPQVAAREAMNLGLVELARIAKVDLSNAEVILTETDSTVEHGHDDSFAQSKSQEKSNQSVETG